MEAQEKNADWYEDRLSEAASSLNTTAIIVGLKMRKRFVEKQQVEAKIESTASTTALNDATIEELDEMLAQIRAKKALRDGSGEVGVARTRWRH